MKDFNKTFLIDIPIGSTFLYDGKKYLRIQDIYFNLEKHNIIQAILLEDYTARILYEANKNKGYILTGGLVWDERLV